MKEFGKIIFYLLATVALGALLAPPLYWGAGWLASHNIFPSLVEYEFRKFFHRALLVAAIALLWPTAKWLRVPGIHSLGLEPNPWRWKDLLAGFLSAFLLMAALAAVLLYLEIYRLRGEIPWGKIPEVIPPVVIVPFLEEWLFRGAILGLLLRGLRPYPALFFVSALFSILHFLKPEEGLVAAGPVQWSSGFALIPGAFSQFEDPLLVLGGFTTLFCVGWILGWTRLRTSSLWLAIGLHAGWIFGIKLFSKLARRRIKDTLPWLGENLSIGLASVAVVLLTGLVVWFWITYGRSRNQGAAQSRG